MAKYSTGSGGSDGGGSCELCGSEGGDLRTATVAGATLQVCGDCARHGDAGDRSTEDDGDADRKKRAARNTAKIQDARSGDASHWEDGAGYDDDQLPYLVADYAERLQRARQDAGLQVDELADRIDADESAVLAVEHGRATQAGVGGSVIERLEDALDVTLIDTS